MWYVVCTVVNPQQDYITQTGYPYVRSDVAYSGNNKNKAENVYNELLEQLANNGEYIYEHNMDFMDNYDAIFKKGRLFYTLQMYKR